MDGIPLKIKEAMEAHDVKLLNEYGVDREGLMELAAQHAIRAEAILKIMEDRDRNTLTPVLVSIVEGGYTEGYEPVEETQISDEAVALDVASTVVNNLMQTLDAHTKYGPVFMFTGSEHLEILADHHTSDQIVLVNSLRNHLIDLSNIFGTNVPKLVLPDRSLN